MSGDEAFFAARDFRTTRFQVVVPECSVSGLAYGELLQGKSYRARSVHFSRPSFEALVNRDKPLKPFVKSPLMVHEALAAIRQPLQIGSLSITNGHVSYGERLAAGADPGVLTFGAVNISVEGIANRGDAAADVQTPAQGDLMNAGTMKVRMSIPTDFAGFLAPTIPVRRQRDGAAPALMRFLALRDAWPRIECGRCARGGVRNRGGRQPRHAAEVRAIYKEL